MNTFATLYLSLALGLLVYSGLAVTARYYRLYAVAMALHGVMVILPGLLATWMLLA